MRRRNSARGALGLAVSVAACSLIIDSDTYTSVSALDAEQPDSSPPAGPAELPDASAVADAGQGAPARVAEPDDDAGPGRGTNCGLPDAHCDGDLVCEPESGSCVECLVDEHCAGDDSPACDAEANRCVECLVDSHCLDVGNGARGLCRHGDTPDDNICVQCNSDAACPEEGRVCNVAAGVCTAECSDNSGCSGNTPVCDTARSQCVECLTDDQCEGSAQCQPDAKRCVPCVDNSACGGDTPICEASKSECVQCLGDGDCSPYAPVTPYCDVPDRICGECTNGGHCTEAGAARCNGVTNACVGCNADSQCTSVAGNFDRCLVPENNAGGTCVRCVENADCANAGNRNLCDTQGGRQVNDCVQCRGQGDCNDPGNARCDGSGTCVGCNSDDQCRNRFQGNDACRLDQQRCVECVNNSHCNGNSDGGVCNTNNNQCVECLQNSDCNGNSAGSVCDTNNGRNQCVECLNDGDCNEPNAPVCKTDTNECVQCTGNGDCNEVNASACNLGTHECQACQNDGECAGITRANATNNSPEELNVCDTTGGVGECIRCPDPSPNAIGNPVFVIESVNFDTSTVVARNVSGAAVTVTTAWQWCDRPVYQSPVAGDTEVAAAEALTFAFSTADATEGEIGLFTADGAAYSDPNEIRAYAVWGTKGPDGDSRETTAVGAGIWTLAERIQIEPGHAGFIATGDSNVAAGFTSVPARCLE